MTWAPKLHSREAARAFLASRLSEMHLLLVLSAARASQLCVGIDRSIEAAKPRLSKARKYVTKALAEISLSTTPSEVLAEAVGRDAAKQLLLQSILPDEILRALAGLVAILGARLGEPNPELERASGWRPGTPDPSHESESSVAPKLRFVGFVRNWEEWSGDPATSALELAAIAVAEGIDEPTPGDPSTKLGLSALKEHEARRVAALKDLVKRLKRQHLPIDAVAALMRQVLTLKGLFLEHPSAQGAKTRLDTAEFVRYCDEVSREFMRELKTKPRTGELRSATRPTVDQGKSGGDRAENVRFLECVTRPFFVAAAGEKRRAPSRAESPRKTASRNR